MFFHTDDHEGELLRRYYTAQGLEKEALDEAIFKAKAHLAAGFPLAYLIGEAAFFDLVFYVNEDVLIPRPDTERVVEQALSLLPPGGVFADLGTGSGAIAVTVARHAPQSRGFALDLSPKALAVAEKNAALCGVSDRLTFLAADLFSRPACPHPGGFDLVISNPPYIPDEEIEKFPGLVYEPRMALAGGTDGLAFYRLFLQDYRAWLKPGGAFVFEIGYDQKNAVTALSEALGYTCRVTKDYGGNDRVALIRPLP